MQHSYKEVITAAIMVRQAYRFTDHHVNNVDFRHYDFEDEQHLVFKGTSKNAGRFGSFALFWDIVSGLRFIPRTDDDYDLGRHPAGFLEAAESFIEYILFKETGIDPNKPLTLCGHSMGGAVLLIAAPVMAAHGMNVKSVITFGSPNVGGLPEVPGLKVTCLKNGWDVVTSLPPFYKDSYKTIRIGKGKKGLIADHRLDSYIDSIKQLKDEWPTDL